MALTQLKTGAIADDAVTTDKLANAINTERTANTAKSTNATHTGEVTGSGALTITADAVTGAKIADDAIDSEHYADGSIDTAHIADNQITLAKMAGGTDGQIITYDASGDPVAVGPGTDGQVLTSTGAGSPPAFEDAAGGGKILQVQSTSSSTTVTTTSASSNIADVINLSITPSATSSKILILSTITIWCDDNGNSYGRALLFRGASSGTALITGEAGATTSAKSRYGSFGLCYMDSPNTTSATTYQLSIQRGSGSTHAITTEGKTYTINLLEIDGS